MGPQGNKGNGLASSCLGHLVCGQPLTILWPVCIVVAAHHVGCLCIQPAHEQCSAQASWSCVYRPVADPPAYTCYTDTPPCWLPVIHPAAILKLGYCSYAHTVVRHVCVCVCVLTGLICACGLSVTSAAQCCQLLHPGCMLNAGMCGLLLSTGTDFCICQ